MQPSDPSDGESRTSGPVASAYDADPETALTVVAGYDGPILVDLDETLYLRNSTEDFVDHAWPAALAMLTLRALDALRPWQHYGGPVMRDMWRVWVVSLLFPWTWARWRLRAAALARRHANRPLLAALRPHGSDVVVATRGFGCIVRPLLVEFGLAASPLIASRLRSSRERRDGKLEVALRRLGAETVASSLVLTDSTDDIPLLARCARPLRTVWPAAQYLPAFSSVYLPGRYTSRVKHPGQRYIWRVVVQADLALWILSSISLAAHPLQHVLGLVVLLASFWAVYERGYVDNDWVAEHLENDGSLTGDYWSRPVSTPSVLPWLWATGLGAVGVSLLRWPAAPAADLAKWLVVLLTTYGLFKIYNRIDKDSRVWLYPALQLARGAAFTVLVPISVAGSCALAAMVVDRWVPYLLYRAAGGPWRNLQTHLLRLLLFLILLSLATAALGLRVIADWATVALLIWLVFKAGRELGTALSRMRWLPRHARGVPQPNGVPDNGRTDRP
jgi:phosphoserine phosphatase